MSQDRKLKIAILQLPVDPDVAANVMNASQALREVKTANPKLRLAILPESFNAPYGMEYFAQYAETVPDGYTSRALANLAQALQIYIIGGSLIERGEGGKLYNTCTVWSPSGQLIAKHRKIHLFTVDIDIENNGGVRFDESAVLTPGHELTIIEVDSRRIGIGVCHDCRFDELARLYRNRGCDMIVYPAAFCICQGPMHWDLLQRARATDNQLFVLTCSPARDNMSGYVAYGHSMIVNPWGQVQREAGATRELIVDDIDFGLVDAVRRQIPLYPQRRLDVYNTDLVKQ